MLIILDGPDGAGKSTIAAELIHELGDDTVYVHRSAQFTTPYALIEYTAPLADYLPGSGINYVLDRWHLSENVYGNLYRGGCKLSPIAWTAVEGMLDRMGAIVAIVHAPVQVLKQRLEARGEQHDGIAEDYEAFSRAAYLTKLPTYWCNTTKATAQELAHALVTQAKRREAYAFD